MMTTDQLTMGVLFPIEAFEGPVPRMDKNEQIALAQQAEELGFDTLWCAMCLFLTLISAM